MGRIFYFSALCAFPLFLLALSAPAPAAQTIEIPVALPITGGFSFLGQGEEKALQIEEKVVNRRGGVGGDHIRFSFHDDQSSPQIAVQLTSQIVAQHPSVMIGSAIGAMCNAMAPLVAKRPVTYCLSPGIHPKAANFVFTSFISARDLARALVAYFRDRGFTRLAMIPCTDASGQDGAAGFNRAMKLPKNKKLTIAAAVQFAPSDVSVSAQIEQIKPADAQALIVWTSGAPTGTVLKRKRAG